jgi:NADP-dependent 3-hydroxy acid dehydrogenase YdfG
MGTSGIQEKVVVITGAGSRLGKSTAKPHRARFLKAMKIGTIARAWAALFLIGVAVSHLQGQGGV